MDRNPVRPTPQEVIGERVRSLALEAGARPREHGFARMFPELAAPAHRLPEGLATLDALLALAATMAEDGEAPAEPRLKSPGDSSVPAAYTYLAQFVLHDMVFERRAGLPAQGTVPGLAEAAAPFDGLVNRRTGRLDLDSLYDAPRDPSDVQRMLLGTVSPSTCGLPRPPRKADLNDLPRHPRSLDPGRDRKARTGDPRNDATLMLSQLTVAFLKAHNTLVESGLSFQEARAALRRRYQWMVLNDLLARLCDREVLEDVLTRGPRAFPTARPGDLAVPVEFAAAAFVVAPTMARASYDFNPAFGNKERGALATRLALGGAGRMGEGLPEHAVIAWEGFLPLEAMAPQRARALDTCIAGAADAAFATAQQHLLKGYALGLPTGQAIAARLRHEPLKGDRLLAALPERQRAAAAPFAEATPLWFYILAEAGDPAGPNGAHLGPVGSRIVAETIWMMVRHGEPSILAPNTALEFERFTLADLVLLAGDQDLFWS